MWAALRNKAGSLARYSALRGALLRDFRGLVVASVPTGNRALHAASNLLLRILHQAVSQTTPSTAAQYELLAGTAFTRKLSIKRSSF